MGLLFKIRKWLSLRKAKEEEKKHIPDYDDMRREQQEFASEANQLKSMTTKEKIYKSSKKSERR